jgi:hypothetical protein
MTFVEFVVPPHTGMVSIIRKGLQAPLAMVLATFPDVASQFSWMVMALRASTAPKGIDCQFSLFYHGMFYVADIQDDGTEWRFKEVLQSRVSCWFSMCSDTACANHRIQLQTIS